MKPDLIDQPWVGQEEYIYTERTVVMSTSTLSPAPQRVVMTTVATSDAGPYHLTMTEIFTPFCASSFSQSISVPKEPLSAKRNCLR